MSSSTSEFLTAKAKRERKKCGNLHSSHYMVKGRYFLEKHFPGIKFWVKVITWLFVKEIWNKSGQSLTTAIRHSKIYSYGQSIKMKNIKFFYGN